MKRTRALIAERAKKIIQNLPQISPIPRAHKPRKRRTKKVTSTDEDSSRGSYKRVAGSGQVRMCTCIYASFIEENKIYLYPGCLL